MCGLFFNLYRRILRFADRASLYILVNKTNLVHNFSEYMHGRIPPCIPDSHLYTLTNTRCHIGTVFSPDDGHIIAPKHAEKSNKHIKKNCAPSWFYLQEKSYLASCNTKRS